MDEAETAEYVRRSEAAAKRALVLDPKQALAVAVQGVNATGVDRIKALKQYDRAVEMAPDNAGILMWAGNELYWSGAYVDEALPLLERAYRLDPLSGINNGLLGITYLAAGQRDLAYQHIRRADELGWPYALDSMMLELVWRGETDAAIEAQRGFLPADESAWTDESRVEQALSIRVLRREITSDELAEVITDSGLFSGDFVRQVHFYLVLGDYERMFDAWLAIESDNEYLFRYIYIPGGRAAMEHPRMIEVAEKQLLFPLWESKGYPFGCERVQDEIGDHLSCPSWPE
jgi:tetratricopeptide (TPR) repeat protein